ncbi:hypothetical protein [Burkholderia multivorans]|uniref:hypothetical protein n=1 Tax=Burkholderia multivorans TaxID=87883 RepID=UPI003EBCC645
MAHWQTAQKFVPGSERLRVYNPILEQHGWHSDHTVIEIVNDDMPFLVDSVTDGRQPPRLALHSALHPVLSASGAAATARSSASTPAAQRPRRPFATRLVHPLRSRSLRRRRVARHIARRHRARARRRTRIRSRTGRKSSRSRARRSRT